MSQETIVKAAPNMLLMLKDISYFLKRSGYNNMSNLENIIKEAEINLEETSNKMLHELKNIHQFLKFNGYDKKLVESVIKEAEPVNNELYEEFERIILKKKNMC